MKVQDLEARLFLLREQREQAVRRIAILDGAIAEATHWHGVLTRASLESKEESDATDRRVDGAVGD